MEERWRWIAPDETRSLSWQCRVLGLSRSNWYQPAGAGHSRRCDAHERDGRAVYEDTVLRKPEDGGVLKSRGLRCESEAGAEADAGDGGFWGLSGSPHKPEPPGASCLSVLTRWGDDRAPEPRLERGHYLCSAGERVCVFGGHPGLVFPICVVFSALQQFRACCTNRCQ